MKALALVALILSLSLVGLTGCRTTPQVAAGKTLVSIARTVDSTMQGWAAWVVAKRGTATPVSAEVETRVRVAYEHYQAAMELARGAYVSAATAADATALAAAMSAVQASQAELLSLITTFKR